MEHNKPSQALNFVACYTDVKYVLNGRIWYNIIYFIFLYTDTDASCKGAIIRYQGVCVCMFMIYLSTKFHMSSCSSSSAAAIRCRKKNVHTAAMLFCHILRI
jgi:hypothetical protein